ncbi:hypothetical protein IV203_026941 [Nitzschia inconspicua]|uniref:Uncharacterized protein n=1 Tax=Nitzschia inconspicua TaxID=303405 RepID=A0A9K3PY57_9STRA|nr:hypothetical protein IV203_026941 [Nitzschia inconspicua]
MERRKFLLLVALSVIVKHFYEETSMMVTATAPDESTEQQEDVAACTLSSDDDEDATCVWTEVDGNTRHYYNKALHADNIIEVDVPRDVVANIQRDYEKDVAPFWHTNQSTDDFCLVAPYTPGVKTWSSIVDDVRSDIRWYSVNNEETYQRYYQHVKQLGLMDRVRELEWIPSDQDLTVFSIFFIPRSFSKKYQFHVDWSEEVGTQVVTFLVPLSNFTIGLAYHDKDDEIRTYNYTLGKAIGVGGGNSHSTGIGRSETQDVLLCVYIGGQSKEMWEYTQENIADELEHYHHPFKGFIRNEFLEGRESKCQ